MTRFLDRHPLCLTALSPIHIGTGEDFDWTSAVLDGDRLVPFDPLAVTLSASALTELEKAADERDAGRAILQLQQVFRRHGDAFVQAARGAAPILPPSIAKRIEAKIGRNVQRVEPGASVVNEIRIARAIASLASGRPLVPGSSLKGTLRTAEIARRDEYRGRPGQPRDREERDLEQRLVGSFHNSPFAKLALSDLEAIDAQPSVVVVAHNVRRRPKEGVQGGKGIPVPVEAVLPFVAGGFRGDVRILRVRGKGDEVEPFEIAALLRTTHDFHRALFSFFRSEIERDPARAYMKAWLDAVENLVDGIQDGRAALVRIGKFGSAESKTVAARRVSIPQSRTHVSNAYTLWLADPGTPGRQLPFGWALLELAEEPGARVVSFCRAMAGTWDYGKTTSRPAPAMPTAAPPSPSAARIVTDRTNDNRDRLATLEDQHDAGRPYGGMLENYIKQSVRWPDGDRLLLARLVRDKLRAKSGLQPFKWRDLDKLLPKLPD